MKSIDRTPRSVSQLKSWWSVLGLIPLFAFVTPGHAQVVLNEIMANNSQAVANGRDFPDYVELMNLSASPVNLSGFSLTDDPLNPRRYVFPDVSVPPNGYLVVWCDANTSSPGLHSGFGLSASGEQVKLYAANGLTVLDQVTFGIQPPDRSIGRLPDGAGAWALNVATAGGPNEAQTTGSKNQLSINEWMARPSVGDDWIELFNRDSLPLALGGLILTDSKSGTPQNRPIPTLSFIGGRGYVQMFASDLDKLDADHLDFKLGADGETLTLYDTDGRTVLNQVTFGAQTDDIAQGRAPDGSDNLAFFPAGTATPGEANFAEIASVVISEILSHSDPPFEDAIELQNVSGSPVDVSHWWLSDSVSSPQKFRIPPGTVIPAGGFVVFYENQFSAGATGFSLDSAEGDEVYLSAGNASGGLQGQQTFVKFGGLINRVSAGRFTTSVGVDFVPLDRPTFGVDNPTSLADFRRGTGQANAPALIGPVVITEIAPGASGTTGAASEYFIELHNPTQAPVPLYDVAYPASTWRLRDGLSFDLPVNITIPAGGFVLITGFDPVQDAARAAAFRSHFNVPESVPLLGPTDGRVSSSGETIKLLQPDEPQGPDKPNAGFVPYQLVDGIEFSAAAPWPAADTSTGGSWQRKEPLSYGNDPVNWSFAAPSPGRLQGGVVTDTDGDGMPDAWETAHGLSPNSPDDAAQDADQDGASNLAEYQAGTDPRDSASVFRIKSFELESGQVRVTFDAVQGKSYVLEATGSLGGGRWLSVTNVNSAPISGPLDLVVPIHPSSAAGYRLTIPSAQ